MYDSNSLFSNVVNRYMSDGVPIVPISDPNGLELPGNMTLDSPTLNLIANLTQTLSSSEYKLLD